MKSFECKLCLEYNIDQFQQFNVQNDLISFMAKLLQCVLKYQEVWFAFYICDVSILNSTVTLNRVFPAQRITRRLPPSSNKSQVGFVMENTILSQASHLVICDCNCGITKIWWRCIINSTVHCEWYCQNCQRRKKAAVFLEEFPPKLRASIFSPIA